MRVRILKQTASRFGLLCEGDSLEVDEETAARWVRRRIAEKEAWTIKELRAVAKDQGIDNYSKMSKAELMKALEMVE